MAGALPSGRVLLGITMLCAGGGTTITAGYPGDMNCARAAPTAANPSAAPATASNARTPCPFAIASNSVPATVVDLPWTPIILIRPAACLSSRDGGTRPRADA